MRRQKTLGTTQHQRWGGTRRNRGTRMEPRGAARAEGLERSKGTRACSPPTTVMAQQRGSIGPGAKGHV